MVLEGLHTEIPCYNPSTWNTVHSKYLLNEWSVNGCLNRGSATGEHFLAVLRHTAKRGGVCQSEEWYYQGVCFAV